MGVLVAVAALVLMIVVGAGDGARLASALVFGVTLIVLYTSSTLYHVVTTPRSKAIVRVVDHASIYLVIAGSYTPLALVSIGGTTGWVLAGTVWGAAMAGVGVKARAGASGGSGRLGGFLSTTLYLGMGWMVVLVFDRVVLALPPAGVWLLVAGGVCYTTGIAFYAWERLPFNHAVWHLFVLAGSICHILATLLYILPGNPDEMNTGQASTPAG